MIRVSSEIKWNDTEIDLIEGHCYKCTTDGLWKDWFIECSADGYSNFLLDIINWTKRNPKSKWFQLIGVISTDLNYTIALGTNYPFTAKKSGRLWVYANDADFAYFNNHGEIDLIIKEVV
jgi:hypothetical protein